MVWKDTLVWIPASLLQAFWGEMCVCYLPLWNGERYLRANKTRTKSEFKIKGQIEISGSELSGCEISV
jgi:hypothetical protein